MVKKKSKLDSQLPATPVTGQMRRTVARICEDADMSMAEFQRLAISLFLSKFANENSSIDTLDSKETA